MFFDLVIFTVGAAWVASLVPFVYVLLRALGGDRSAPVGEASAFAFLATVLAFTFGGIFLASTATPYVESCAAIQEQHRMIQVYRDRKDRIN